MRRKRFGGVLLALLISVPLVVGFARNWLRLSSDEDATRDQVNVNLTLDRAKFQSDSEQAFDKVIRKAAQLADSIKHGTFEVTERDRDKLRREQLRDSL
jgi:hypothetical protein